MVRQTDMVRAAGLRGFETLVDSLGGDARILLRRHRIPVHSLRQEDALIPFRSAAEMLEDAAITLNCPDFGLKLTGSYDASVLGPLGIAIQHSATVAEGLQLTSRYLFMHCPAMLLRVISRSDLEPRLAELRVEFSTHGWTIQRQAIDACLSAVFIVTRGLARKAFRLDSVSLPHQPSSSLAYRRFFGAPIRLAQPQAALLLPHSTLKAPLSGSNKAIQDLAADYLRTHFPTDTPSVTARTRDAIRQTIGLCPHDKTRISTMLAMHPRTLQRRLLNEGSCYEAILDEVRKESAMRYLESTQLPLKQIADLLGLSHQSALTRSCKRWFGRTPIEIRGRDACSMGRM